MTKCTIDNPGRHYVMPIVAAYYPGDFVLGIRAPNEALTAAVHRQAARIESGLTCEADCQPCQPEREKMVKRLFPKASPTHE